MQRVMLCVDVAGAILCSPKVSQQLLAQAQGLISEAERSAQRLRYHSLLLLRAAIPRTIYGRHTMAE
eukprot:scaffold331579_cov54-Prasinocladus_malaysianus.AAC.1